MRQTLLERITFRRRNQTDVDNHDKIVDKT
jgi:hypothetical protein